MAAFNLTIPNFGFARAQNLSAAATRFVMDRTMIPHLAHMQLKDFATLLSQPPVPTLIVVWAGSFTVIMIAWLGLGFGPAGIGAGSVAAGFQSWMYGGFTPAAGVFATLTSVGMLGLLMPVGALFAAGVATLTTLVAWVC